MAQFIDRRINSKNKSAENRQKFINRVRKAIKEALPDIVNGKKLEDIGKTGGKVRISRKSISEPTFRHGRGGVKDYIIPGNKEYVPGDEIDKNRESRSRGGTDGEDGEDDFIVEITDKEFLDAFFDGLELPDLVKSSIHQIEEVENIKGGWAREGCPAKLSVITSMKQSKMRRGAIGSKWRKELKALEIELQAANECLGCKDEHLKNPIVAAAIERITARMKVLKDKLAAMTFIDPMDLRFHTTTQIKHPATTAAMICIMDVSGSMGEREKMIARKFFYLLYAFLTRQYKNISLSFIIHTTEAQEVDEKEFFSTRVNGGTLVSSALELAHKIIAEKYQNENVYICQISDGDNSSHDNGTCSEIIEDDLLPNIQYYAYAQIEQERSYDSDDDYKLWTSYSNLAKQHDKFNIVKIQDDSDIWPVFKKLFSSRER